jgi:hypothetical protein
VPIDPEPIPSKSPYLGGELGSIELPTPKLKPLDGAKLGLDSPNKLPMVGGGGPAGVEEGPNDLPGGGPAGVVEGSSRLE